LTKLVELVSFMRNYSTSNFRYWSLASDAHFRPHAITQISIYSDV